MDSEFAPTNPQTSDPKNLLPLVKQLENSKDDAVSLKGAVGAYQITKDTADTYHLDYNRLKTDPTYNEAGATTILSDLHKRFQGNTNDILTAYNAGPHAADRWIAGGRRLADLPQETQGYLNRADGLLNVPSPKPGLASADQTPQPQQAALTDWDNKAAKARAAGYSWDEINQYAEQKRQAAKAAGYSDAEIDTYFGMPGSHDGGQPIPGQEKTPPTIEEQAPNLPSWLRKFADDYLTPRTNTGINSKGEPISMGDKVYVHTVGDFMKMIGWDAIDLGKSFGQPIVNGVAAIMEGMDGRPRTQEDMERLGREALPVLGFFAGGMKFAPEGRLPVPSREVMIDAATAVTPKGEDIHPAMQALGKHYAETGQHPIEAANENLKLGGNQIANDKLKAQAAANTRGLVERINSETGGVNFSDKLKSQNDEILNLGRGDQSTAKPNPFRALLESKSGSVEFTPPEMDITPETIGQSNPEIGKGIVDDLRRIFNPAARSDMAGITAAITKEGLGETAQRLAQSADSLRRFGRVVGQLPSRERLAYLDAIETGNIEQYKGTPLGDLATELRRQFDARWDMLNETGNAPNYITNYMPHVWDDPDAANAYFSRRPLGGNKSFTRQRTYATIQEGMANGLKLKTDNPIELSLMQLHQMDKAITEKSIMDQIAEAGILVKRSDLAEGERVPPGLTRINSNTFSNDEAFAPEHVATIINRYISPGLSGRPIYDMVRSAGNMMNMAQLAISGFHASFVTADAFTSGLAKGVKQISRGVGELSPAEFLRGVGSLMVSPAAPVRNYLAGRQVIRQYLGRQNYGTEVQTIADALVSGGGRIGLDATYRGSAAGSFWQNLRGSLGSGEQTLGQALVQMYRDAPDIKVRSMTVLPGFVRATAQLVPRVMDTIMAPLMQHYVPTMKAGVFSDLMADELRAAPEMGPVEQRAVAGRLWNSVDNRLGQLVYDNLFWNKTMRDIGHIAVRSLGWNLGTVRELIGGTLDFSKGLAVSESNLRQLTDRASYVVALPIATYMMGTLYSYLKGTWSSDMTLQDHLFPKTGGKDAQGGDERVSMPGYFKDVFNLARHPLTTAEDKIHPLATTTWDMMNNRQWNGAAISDPRAPYLAQSKDYSEFLMEQFKPIILQQAPDNADSNITVLERALGLKPAPFGVREPELEEKFQNKATKAAVTKKEKMEERQ